eukprot:jgi/Bigna1/91172/estExt_fgenesh1_pg.C_910060
MATLLISLARLYGNLSDDTEIHALEIEGFANQGGALEGESVSAVAEPPVKHTSCRIAILLVGHYKIVNATIHGKLLLENVVKPLHADLYVSADAPPDAPKGKDLEEIVRILGSTVKGVVLTNATVKGLRASFPGSPKLRQASILPQIPNLSYLLKATGGQGPNSGSGPQWFRLKYAWELMESAEKESGQSYDIVIKLRFDATPITWSRSLLCAVAADAKTEGGAVSTGEGALDGTRDRLEAVGDQATAALFAMSDYAFWGRRSVFKVAASLADNMEPFFLKRYRAPSSRPYHVQSLYQSFLSAHKRAFLGFPAYWYYNKLGAMWVPDVVVPPLEGNRSGKGGGGDKKWALPRIIAGIQRLFCHDNLRYVYPGTKSAPPMRAGPLAARADFHKCGQLGSSMNACGFMAGEPAFAVWMIANNVTMCEIGANISQVAVKGHIHMHETRNACTFVKKMDVCGSESGEGSH